MERSRHERLSLAAAPAGVWRHPAAGRLGVALDDPRRGRVGRPAGRTGQGLGAGRGARPAARRRRPELALVPLRLRPSRPLGPGDAARRRSLPGGQRLAQWPPARLALRLLRALRLRHHLLPGARQPAGHLLRVADRDRPRPQEARDGHLQRRGQPPLPADGVLQPAGALSLGGADRPLAGGGAGVPRAGRARLAPAPAAARGRRRRGAGSGGAAAQPGRPGHGGRDLLRGQARGRPAAQPRPRIPDPGRAGAEHPLRGDGAAARPLVALADGRPDPPPGDRHSDRERAGVGEGGRGVRLSRCAAPAPVGGLGGACQRLSILHPGRQLPARAAPRPAQPGAVPGRPRPRAGDEPGRAACPRPRPAGGVLPPRRPGRDAGLRRLSADRCLRLPRQPRRGALLRGLRPRAGAGDGRAAPKPALDRALDRARRPALDRRQRIFGRRPFSAPELLHRPGREGDPGEARPQPAGPGRLRRARLPGPGGLDRRRLGGHRRPGTAPGLRVRRPGAAFPRLGCLGRPGPGFASAPRMRVVTRAVSVCQATTRRWRTSSRLASATRPGCCATRPSSSGAASSSPAGAPSPTS